jgi:uncharacterized protein YqeY
MGWMLIDTIKARALEAMKSKDTLASTIFRLALGEIQTAEARSGRAVTDEEAIAIVRKLVKSNEETLSMAEGTEQKATLEKELTLLKALLPQSLSVADIVLALAPVAAAIKEAKNEGQATGVAMKHLKSQGTAAAGTDVATAVKQLRA